MIILRRVQWLSAAALSVGLFSGSASADDDLCAAVQGLCASNHLANVAALKEAIGPEAAARVSAAEEALRQTPGIGRDATTSVAAGAALRDGQIIGDNSLLPEALRNNNAAAQTPPDAARFGRRPEADPLGTAFAGTQDRVRGNRQSSGTSGVARNSVTAGGMPSRGSLLRNSGGPALDHSSPNEDGGVTRHTVQRDGTTTVTRTGGNEDGSSYVQTDTINPDGSESHTVIITGGADNPGYRHMTKAERASPSELYTIRSSDSYNGGASWTPERGHQDAIYTAV